MVCSSMATTSPAVVLCLWETGYLLPGEAAMQEWSWRLWADLRLTFSKLFWQTRWESIETNGVSFLPTIYYV